MDTARKLGCGTVTNGSKTNTRMPKASVRSASARPIRPWPMMPSEAPRNSRPITGSGSWPARSGATGSLTAVTQASGGFMNSVSEGVDVPTAQRLCGILGDHGVQTP